MIRIAAFSLAGLAVVTVAGCAPSNIPPQNEPLPGSQDANSPIAGAMLRCPQDYPDSVLVFAADGTLGGRYAGQEVSGEWTAVAPERVEVLVRAGGLAVRDTIRRTGAGWRGENTACG